MVVITVAILPLADLVKLKVSGLEVLAAVVYYIVLYYHINSFIYYCILLYWLHVTDCLLVMIVCNYVTSVTHDRQVKLVNINKM